MQIQASHTKKAEHAPSPGASFLPTAPVNTASTRASPKGLNDLPEELIEHIFKQLQSQASLAAVSATSREFHRIVEPILYNNVTLVVSSRTEDDTVVPAKHETTRAFLRTIAARPHLRRYVKTLKITSNGKEDFVLSLKRDIVRIRSRSTPALRTPGTPMGSSGRTMVPYSGVQKLLLLLSNLEVFNAAKYSNSEFPNSIKETTDTRIIISLKSDIITPLVANLKHVELGYHTTMVLDLHAVLKMPNLEHLVIHGWVIRGGGPYIGIRPHMDNWLRIEDCRLTTLSLLDVCCT